MIINSNLRHTGFFTGIPGPETGDDLFISKSEGIA